MRRVLSFVGVLVAVTLLVHGDSRADAAGDAARRAQIVLRVGPARTITVGELEDRIAAMPPFQRATFGVDADTMRHAVLTQILLPEALLAAGGEEQKVDQQLPTSYAVERARHNATIRAIRERIGPESAIPMEDVQKYYEANRARYDTPERYQLWRILCKDRDEAQSVLDAARKEPTPKEFGELARDHSLDKATNLRAGNLGFVTADGASNEPGLRVDPAIVRAAQAVHDGQLVPAPVPEGEHFSVVWRRGTIAASKRSVDDVAAQIRDAVWKARVKEETAKLLASLRTARLRDLDEALLATLDVSLPAGAGGTILRADGGATPPAGSER